LAKLCIVCKKNIATIPDRNQRSKRNKVCGKCHSERLREDLGFVLDRMGKAIRQEGEGE